MIEFIQRMGYSESSSNSLWVIVMLFARCSSCEQGHRASDQAAGRTLACRKCGSAVTFPYPEPEVTESETFELLSDAPQQQETEAPVEEPAEQPEEVKPPPRVRVQKKEKPVKPLPAPNKDHPLWRQHLIWVLLLALVPLAIALLSSPDDLKTRIARSMSQMSPQEKERFTERLANAKSFDDLVSAFPGERFPGAFLSRHSSSHYGMAAGSAVLFFAFLFTLAWDKSAHPLHLVLVVAFTATIGIGFLLLVQYLASMTEGRIVIRGGLVTLVFFVLKFIAFSYNAAMDPENGFWLSFFGYTAGVGLCEELVKLIPAYRHEHNIANGPALNVWRGVLLWGLASGIGFGIAEGVMYSAQYYNGVSGSGTYVIRFASCVALHAIWSGCAAITLYLRRDSYDEVENWYDLIFPTLLILAIPALLHGLYDTSLKRDMPWLALLTAIASFGYLAILFRKLYAHERINREKFQKFQAERKLKR